MGIRTAGETAVIVGLDPGRDKTGWALVRPSGDLLLSGMFPSAELDEFLKVLIGPSTLWESALARWLCERRGGVVGNETAEYFAVGDGTGSAGLSARIERLGAIARSVDERGTTLAARDLYWRLHRPAWWQRCLPRSLRVPPRVLDDLAAWAIVLRSIDVSFFAEGKSERS